jgi:hypothetical protein
MHAVRIILTAHYFKISFTAISNLRLVVSSIQISQLKLYMTTHLHLVPSAEIKECVELYLHSLIYLHGVVLS